MRSLLALLLLSSCSSDVSAQASARLIPAFPALAFTDPVDVQAPPDGSGRLFVVEQGGTVRVFEEAAETGTTDLFLDLRDRVASGGEMGLLGLAFHPRFPDSNYVYVNYTATNPRRTVIARFTVPPATPNAADAGSERVLLEVVQPFSNHNAGQIQFGPDGYLYVGLGDGGSGGDPQNHGQTLGTLLGSMLRLDVDGGGLPPDCGGPDARYTIPSSNPFIGHADACDEAFAYGFRNPWRFSFGPDGTFYVADVGQGAWEEVNTVVAGGNYGWNRLEGRHCYTDGCDPTGTTLPVAEYPHDRETGGYSITGGYVYTGTEAGCEPLRGKCLYGDYVSGNVWSLDLDGGSPQITHLVQNADLRLSTFGVGNDGVLYLADHSDGTIHRFDCDSLSTYVRATGSTGSLRLSEPAPNPASGVTHLRLTSGRSQPVEVAVFDVLGRCVRTLVSGLTASASPTVLQMDTTSLPSGVYLIQARGGAETILRRLIVAR